MHSCFIFTCGTISIFGGGILLTFEDFLRNIIQVPKKNTYTSGSRPLWARSKFDLWYAALGVVKMLHIDNKQQIRKCHRFMRFHAENEQGCT